MKSVIDVFAEKKFSKDIFESSKFVIDMINKSLELMSYNSGSNHACNFKLATRFVFV